MKPLSLILSVSWLCLLTVFANPIADNPLFKKLEGNWEGEGALKNAQDQETPLKETWTGKFTETGNFIMSGKRLLDQQEHEFAWEFYPNGDLIEGQMKISEPEIDTRFEVVISEADQTITMKIPLSGDGTIMTIVNKFEDDGKTITGTVKIKNQSGQETLAGGMVHKRTES